MADTIKIAFPDREGVDQIGYMEHPNGSKVKGITGLWYNRQTDLFELHFTPDEIDKDGVKEQLLATIKNLQKALHDIEQSLQVHGKHTITGYYNPKADEEIRQELKTPHELDEKIVNYVNKMKQVVEHAITKADNDQFTDQHE